MSINTPRPKRRVTATSWSLVSAQFVLIALIVSPVRTLIHADEPHQWIGLACLIAAMALALWALASMRRRNFSVFPEPVQTGELVQRGPYRHVRHPMYSAVLLGCAGATISHASALKLALWCGLVAVLLIKIAREERFLQQHYSAYDEYRNRTSALFPWFANPR